ncbi:DUF1488 family protein [Paraburkholderia tropica]|uniref:DUF1488 domain-containing protein n=1 Tax=Paraburkholderia tropica TaxID=92647 RepID=UPI0015903AA6|nr:DUF1488 domain-containing protein [Paraburkholderia tropica]
MDITFPPSVPQYDAQCYTLVFPVCVDGKRIECGITAEALEDHFGARSVRETDLVEAFDEHRHAIEDTAVTLIQATRGAPVLLHSGVFRVYGS